MCVCVDCVCEFVSVVVNSCCLLYVGGMVTHLHTVITHLHDLHVLMCSLLIIGKILQLTLLPRQPEVSSLLLWLRSN